MYRHDEGDELERLLEGSAQAREQHPELRIFVDDVQAMPAASPATEDLHVAAMMSESSRLLAENGDPVARPVSKAHGPAPQASGLSMRRSTPMVKLLLAKVMAPLVAVFTLMGGLAYAQVLPDPLQNVVAGAGGAIGLDLPDSDDGDVEETDEVAEDEDALEDDTAVEDEDEGAVEDDDQGAQDDDDQGAQDDDDQGVVDDEATDDDSDSGPGGGDDDDEADDDSGSGGSSGGGSDDEVEESESED